jgi:hypothetical protein
MPGRYITRRKREHKFRRRVPIKLNSTSRYVWRPLLFLNLQILVLIITGGRGARAHQILCSIILLGATES